MENITAFFRNRHDMDLAATALREQGAIDIQLGAVEQGASADLPDSFTMSGAGRLEQPYMLQVVVESSRCRQAEDTLARFGGRQ